MNTFDAKQFREQIRILERKLGLLKKSTESNNELTLTQCHTLVEIGRAHTISLKDLSLILAIDLSTTSRTVANLVKKSYVQRTPSIQDRRSVDITLTSTGQTLFNHIETTNNTFFQEVFENIPLEKRESVLTALEIILEAFQQEAK